MVVVASSGYVKQQLLQQDGIATAVLAVALAVVKAAAAAVLLVAKNQFC